MSFKLLQFSPQSSTRALRMSDVPERWITNYAFPQDMGFVRAWMQDDSYPLDGPPKQVNWGAVAGLALSLTVSGAFWAGLGLLIAHFV